MKEDAIEKLAQLLFDKIMEKQEQADVEYAEQIQKLYNEGYTISAKTAEKYKDELGLNQEERLVGELARLQTIMMIFEDKEEYEKASLVAGLGQVISSLSASELQDKGVLAQCHVNVIQTQELQSFRNYQEELTFLTTNQNRMQFISNLVEEIRSGGNTLILIDRIKTGEALKELIPGSVFIQGKTKMEERQEEYNEVATEQYKVLIATYGVAAVGINLPRIFNLVLVEPGKSFVRVIQSIGRGIRKAKDKDHVQIWDITSSCKFSKRHLTTRKKFYKEANYPYTVNKVNI